MGDDERGLGQVVFGGNLLHQLIGEPAAEAIDHGRVAGKGTVAEGIDLMEFKLHGTISLSGGPQSMPAKH
ncbi:hypothetical protein D3C80_1926200 [compost metagenome]